MKIHYAVPEKGARQAVFLESAITDDKVSLKTSALAPFIQSKLYLQYNFIVLL